jgi:hypothetical protein
MGTGGGGAALTGGIGGAALAAGDGGDGFSGPFWTFAGAAPGISGALAAGFGVGIVDVSLRVFTRGAGCFATFGGGATEGDGVGGTFFGARGAGSTGVCVIFGADGRGSEVPSLGGTRVLTSPSGAIAWGAGSGRFGGTLAVGLAGSCSAGAVAFRLSVWPRSSASSRVCLTD